MRMARIKADGAGFYHCMSRAIEGRFILGSREKEHFLLKMRKLEDFCGLRIITYSILDSHWHILLEVPDRQEITDTELIRRIEVLYDEPAAAIIRSEFERVRESGDSKAVERFRNQYTHCRAAKSAPPILLFRPCPATWPSRSSFMVTTSADCTRHPHAT